MKWGIMQFLCKISVFNLVCFVVLLLGSNFVAAQEVKKVTNVKFEYSKHRKIDLGALRVDGEFVVPLDLSVDVDEENHSLGIYRRKDFKVKLNNNFETFY